MKQNRIQNYFCFEVKTQCLFAFFRVEVYQQRVKRNAAKQTRETKMNCKIGTKLKREAKLMREDLQKRFFAKY
jgi:hypothetical protein